MKKYEKVKSNVLFNDIINNGSKVSNKFFTCFFVQNQNNKSLFGISCPKKYGNAVVRNKCKRQIRELLDKTKKLFKNNRNYIIIMKEGFLNSNYEERLEQLKNLIGDINEK